MRKLKVPLAFLAALLCALPGTLSATTVSFTSHTSAPCTQQCGGPQTFQHIDMNNDGREDLVSIYTPVMGIIDQFLVQLASGDGTYGAATYYTIPGNSNYAIYNLVLGDFNNDGKADVAVFSSDDNLYIYLNNGAGALTLSTTVTPYPNSQSGSPLALVADFNHDGKQDIAYALSGQIYVLFGNGKAGFTSGPITSTQPNVSRFLFGDFDGDGKADLAYTTGFTANGNITILYGDNTGHFTGSSNISADTSGPVTAYDVNSDGRTDFLTVSITPATVKHVSVLYGNVARTFANRTTIATTRCVSGPVSVADLDGNGLNDLIVPEEDVCGGSTGTTHIAVLTRNSNSSYNTDQTVYTSPAIGGVVYPVVFNFAARADQNSKPDLVIGQCTDLGCDTEQITDLLNTTASSGFPTCAPPNSLEGINICTPTTAPISSPVAFAIGAAGPVIMRDVEVWVDGSKLAEQIDGFSNYTFLNHNLSLSSGTHKVAIYAAGWDQFLQEKTFTLTVK